MDTLTPAVSGDAAPKAARTSSSVSAHDRQIVSTSLRIAGLVLIAKLVVAAREVAIANYYGVGPVVDAYNVAITVVTWIPILATAVFASVFVPAYVALRSDEVARDRFVAEVNGLVLLSAIGLLVLTAIIGPAAARLIGGSLPDTGRALAAALAWQMAPYAAALLVIGFYTPRLQAEQRFLYSALEALPALGVCVAAVALSASLGWEALAIGTVLGGLAQMASIAAFTRGLPGKSGLALRLTSPQWRGVGAAILALGMGQVLIYSSLPIDQAFAAASGSGGVALLGFASRLLGIATSLGTIVIGRALLPIMSVTITTGGADLARAQTIRWSLIAMGLAAVLAALASLASGPAVRLLLERGAFTSADSDSVARLVDIGLVQLPFYLGSLVCVQWLAAAGRYRTIAVIAGVTLMAKVIALFLLRRWGIDGVMASTVIMYAVGAMLHLAIVRRSVATFDRAGGRST